MYPSCRCSVVTVLSWLDPLESLHKVFGWQHAPIMAVVATVSTSCLFKAAAVLYWVAKSAATSGLISGILSPQNYKIVGKVHKIVDSGLLHSAYLPRSHHPSKTIRKRQWWSPLSISLFISSLLSPRHSKRHQRHSLLNSWAICSGASSSTTTAFLSIPCIWPGSTLSRCHRLRFMTYYLLSLLSLKILMTLIIIVPRAHYPIRTSREELLALDSSLYGSHLWAIPIICHFKFDSAPLFSHYSYGCFQGNLHSLIFLNVFFSDTEINALWQQTYSDTYLTNVTYSKVGGLSTHELALLESETLQLLDWELSGTSEMLQGYYEKVLRLVRVTFFLSYFRVCYSFSYLCEL